MTDDYSMVATLLPLALLWPMLGVPLIMGKIPRNGLYGFRTPSTLSDDRIWYPVNRSAGWYMVGNGVLSLVILIGISFGLFRVSEVVVLLMTLLLLLLGVALGVLQARTIKSALDVRARSDD